MKNKKKNSVSGNILFNENIPSAFQKPSIFDFDSFTCNGIPIQDLDDKLIKILPIGIKVRCHMCEPPKDFKTYEEASKHDEIIHFKKTWGR